LRAQSGRCNFPCSGTRRTGKESRHVGANLGRKLRLAVAIAIGAAAPAWGNDRTERVSVGPGGVQADDGSESSPPGILALGRFVAFASGATNLVKRDTNESVDVFVRDREAGTTARVSVGPGGVEGDDASRNPALSADGRVVAFGSAASDLVAGDNNGAFDVFVRILALP
jgi:hypothetical protein